LDSIYFFGFFVALVCQAGIKRVQKDLILSLGTGHFLSSALAIFKSLRIFSSE